MTKAARAIQDFVIDDLSNWYVRRNRRRFWKAEMGDEKLSAYQTLYESLLTVAKLIAPFAPFFAEEIYRNLNADGLELHESVHLSQYPDSEDSRFAYLDDALVERMALAREVVSLCRSARNEAGIKVRQPLKRSIVVVSGKRQREAIQKLESLITNEVNIRELEFADDATQILEKKALPVFKNLGPKFGSHVNQAADIIRRFTPDEIRQLESGEAIHISLDKGKHGEVVLADVDVVSDAVEGLVVQSNAELTVALDTRLDDDLIAEGLSREFVNRIQNMRRDAGLEVVDRIHVYYEASDKMQHAIRLKHEYIKEEVLAVSLEEGFQKGKYHKEWELDQEWLKVGIKDSTLEE